MCMNKGQHYFISVDTLSHIHHHPSIYLICIISATFHYIHALLRFAMLIPIRRQHDGIVISNYKFELGIAWGRVNHNRISIFWFILELYSSDKRNVFNISVNIWIYVYKNNSVWHIKPRQMKGELDYFTWHQMTVIRLTCAWFHCTTRQDKTTVPDSTHSHQGNLM